ncbi:unnamed protein product [Darwinula stevensoni]|uniref:DUF4097 domain-containing protein n=1 Tax=Darwinula stevensoni TaxID=69355 RepID=A0A7R9AA20_9CRUS|nr:unnamed protein product [Darwinula stevensoni]CAG0897995.1 unnamed protein product [Darwinula stevensoni]
MSMDKAILSGTGPEPVDDTLMFQLEDGRVILRERKRSCQSLSLFIPIKYDVLGKAEDGSSVMVSSLEPQTVRVESSSGDIMIQDIKCLQCNLISESGNIHCGGHVEGNFLLHTGSKGSIRVEKLIGDKMDLRCMKGGIFSQSLYCQEGKVVCNGGQLNLSNLHGRFSIHAAKAKLVHLNGLLGSVRGHLDCQSSTVHIVGLEDDATIESPGDVHLILGNDFSGQITCQCREFAQPDDLSPTSRDYSKLAENVHQVLVNVAEKSHCKKLHVVAPNSRITLEQTDWLSSLNLGKWHH